jgi:hypothetical protein
MLNDKEHNSRIGSTMFYFLIFTSIIVKRTQQCNITFTFNLNMSQGGGNKKKEHN